MAVTVAAATVVPPAIAAVAAAVAAWQATGSDRSGFGSLIDDATIDDLTGGGGVGPNVVDEFHSADDYIRDLRASDGDSIIP